jgi:hypothetical protein
MVKILKLKQGMVAFVFDTKNLPLCRRRSVYRRVILWLASFNILQIVIYGEQSVDRIIIC